MARNYSSLYRRLHGRREIRVTVDDFGGVIHKPFEYPGVPHVDIIPGAIAVDARMAARVEEIFKKFKVAYMKITPRKVESTFAKKSLKY